MNDLITPEEAASKLAAEHQFPFTVVFRRGMLSVEYFAPAETDTQTPHRQDELYIIINGTGILHRDGERLPCKPGDLLFVPAGMEHRFEHFTPGFATWVIFFGEESGMD